MDGMEISGQGNAKSTYGTKNGERWSITSDEVVLGLNFAGMRKLIASTLPAFGNILPAFTSIFCPTFWIRDI